MARGFDSKSVSEQQEEAQRRREAGRGPRTPVLSPRRRKLELARVDLLRRLETASGRYRETLEGALAALEDQMRREEKEGAPG